MSREIRRRVPSKDLRQRRLAEARRTGEQHMVERIAPPPRRLDENPEVGARLLLADEFVERLRTIVASKASTSFRALLTSLSVMVCS